MATERRSRKKPPDAAPAGAASPRRDPARALRAELAKELGVGEAEVTLRALQELAERVRGTARATQPAPAQPPAPQLPAAPSRASEPPRPRPNVSDASADPGPPPTHGISPSSTSDRALGHAQGLPQRLYVLLNGRGLDGMGMPVEVIDVPCLVGSGRTCTIWVNAPGIETRHAVITQGDEGWVIEDLGSERGTFLNGERIARKVLVTGDSFLLAGYLAMRVELR